MHLNEQDKFTLYGHPKNTEEQYQYGLHAVVLPVLILSRKTFGRRNYGQHGAFTSPMKLYIMEQEGAVGRRAAGNGLLAVLSMYVSDPQLQI